MTENAYESEHPKPPPTPRAGTRSENIPPSGKVSLPEPQPQKEIPLKPGDGPIRFDGLYRDWGDNSSAFKAKGFREYRKYHEYLRFCENGTVLYSFCCGSGVSEFLGAGIDEKGRILILMVAQQKPQGEQGCVVSKKPC